MLNVIQYTGDLVPVELSTRPLDGFVDLWMRRNPGTDQDPDGNTIQTADEAFMTFDADAAPTQAEVEANFDEWFDRASAWTGESDYTDVMARLEAAEAKNAELSNILYTLMGVNTDA